ncbi:MAG: phosphoglycerate kinase [Alphaproteobacteria bacterium]|nr:phosphoglycerate kinase [Alphaproteobacteria bacterium]
MGNNTALHTIDDLDVKGKRVLLRVDLNVPMQNGTITDTLRIDRILPTVQALSKRGAKVILLSHLDRPKGKVVPGLSLRPLVTPLGEALGQPVGFAGDCVGNAAAGVVAELGESQVALLENLRFHAGEEMNDDAFASALAELGDLYVNDAFSCSHRAHASVERLAKKLPSAAGPVLVCELATLKRMLENPSRPILAIVGGAKISTKLDIINYLIGKVDTLAIVGAMANTFLLAKGHAVGTSLVETTMVEKAQAILAAAEKTGCRLFLPEDAVIATELRENVAVETVPVSVVPEGRMILDAGPETVARLSEAVRASRTLVWNGPLGAFETAPFDAATMAVAKVVAACTREGELLSIGGGGDTVAALHRAGLDEDFSYVSTAGGAFLDWLGGKELPGIAALQHT